MEIPTLKAQSRTAAGTRAAMRLRRGGRVPAILYGQATDPVTIALDCHDVQLHLDHGVHVVQLEMENRLQPCQFKDAQYDHLGAALVHVDLMRVDITQRLKFAVRLDFRGNPKGVAAGGVFHHEMTELEIECLVSEIPDNIRVDIGDLELNQVLYVKDLKLPERVAAVTDPDSVVAVIRLPAAAPTVEAAPAVEGAVAVEPEVIAKGKVEEEGEEKE